MGWGKVSSLVVGLAAAGPMVPLTWWLGGLAHPPLLGVVTLLVAAALLGLFVGLVHALCLARAETQIRQMAARIEGLARGGTPVPLPAGGAPAAGVLAHLAAAVERATGDLRRRVEELTMRKRELDLQLRLSDAERRHVEAVLNSISDPVLVTDAFNEVAAANESAARALGFDVRRALRQPVDQVLREPRLVKLIKDARAAGAGAPRRRLEHAVESGPRRTVYDVTVARVGLGTGPGPRGGPRGDDADGVVTVLRDITREKEVAEMKSDFVSSVSHELRTPLSSIRAYMEMLVDGEAADERTRAEFYNIIQGETNRLSRLIDTILNLSRIESGLVKVQREPVALPALMREVLDVMAPQARAKGIELALGEPAAAPGLQVFADRDMIYQAALNLVGNAVKYTPAGGRVRVSVGRAGDPAGGKPQVEVTVADNGVGIPPEAVAHLFGKFYRVPEHKRLANGTGLGLNLVKQVIETVHGGQVGVESRPGQGSRFTFRLPMAEDSD